MMTDTPECTCNLYERAPCLVHGDVWLDERGVRHARGCDVIVYDDANRECSLGCPARDTENK